MIVASVATAAVEEIPNLDKITPTSFPIAFGVRSGMNSEPPIFLPGITKS